MTTFSAHAHALSLHARWRARILQLVGGARWVVVAVAGLCVMVSGCTVAATGRPVAGADLGRWQPPPILPPHLGELLLSGGQVDAAAGTTGMAVALPFSEMQHGEALVPDLGCLDAYSPAEAAVYAGSNWNSVEGQLVNDLSAPAGRSTHSLFEAVVGFRDADSARQFFGRAKAHWSGCAHRGVTINSPGHPLASWSFGEAVATDTTLSLTQTREGVGTVCQRVLGLANNVIVDTLWCGFDTTNQAGAVVTTISAAIAQA